MFTLCTLIFSTELLYFLTHLIFPTHGNVSRGVSSIDQYPCTPQPPKSHVVLGKLCCLVSTFYPGLNSQRPTLAWNTTLLQIAYKLFSKKTNVFLVLSWKASTVSLGSGKGCFQEWIALKLSAFLLSLAQDASAVLNHLATPGLAGSVPYQWTCGFT